MEQNVNPQAETADVDLDPEVQEVAEEQDRHPVPGDESGHVLARSSGPGAEAAEQDQERYENEHDGEAYKDTTQLAPAPSPLDPNAAATQSPLDAKNNPPPARHQHSAHEADSRDLSADEADYDADERSEEDDTNASS